MKYILFDKKTNKVNRNHILNKPPIVFSDCLQLARCEFIPQGKQFLAINIQEKQEEYTEKISETVTLITGEEKEIIKAVTKTRNYKVCDLIALY